MRKGIKKFNNKNSVTKDDKKKLKKNFNSNKPDAPKS